MLGKSGAGVCDGQMPFPPEILAPPADRVKKEKKPKAPKNKKETAGKVREEKGKHLTLTHKYHNDCAIVIHNIPFSFV